jgi:hypothetical protein
MSNEAVQSARFGPATAGPLGQSVKAALRSARALLAHVRETIGGDSAAEHESLGGMNPRMRRDVGAEGSLGPHSSANRQLLYPRL